MGDPRALLPHEVEIFVVRELRKAGLDPSAVKKRDRPEPARASGEYTVQLSCVLRVGDADQHVLIECRNAAVPVDAARVEAFRVRMRDAETPHGMIFSTSGFAPDAIRAARTSGIPVLAVADGKSAFARSPWGMAGDPPAWVPEYMAELVDLDVTGKPRHTLLASGGSRRILDLFDEPRHRNEPEQR